MCRFNASITVDQIEYMLDGGSDINHQDRDGNTPFSVMCEYNASITVDLLP